MTEIIDDRFTALLGSRSEKPRRTGKTMVIGDGPHNIGGMNYLDDLMEFAGAWIDSYKFQRGSLALQPPELIQSKLELFAENEILAYPGGNFLEAAVHNNSEDRFFNAVREIGCPGIEVSSTSIEIELQEKATLFEQATEMGFYVHSEIGKKESETGGNRLTETEVMEEIELSLNAGAKMIIMEMEQIEQTREASNGETNSVAVLERYADTIGKEKVLFELPLASYYDAMEASWWYINNIGSEVNLGNVNPAHVLPLEQQRRGMGQYAFNASHG